MLFEIYVLYKLLETSKYKEVWQIYEKELNGKNWKFIEMKPEYSINM